MTTSGDNNPGLFDRFAARVADQVARPWFFSICVLMVLVWAPSLGLFGSVDTWQLVINTATTIVTFLLVALLQNTQDRSTRALHRKLDAISNAVAFVLEDTAEDEEASTRMVAQLRKMAGVEMTSKKS